LSVSCFKHIGFSDGNIGTDSGTILSYVLLKENSQQWDEKARDQKMLRDGEANEEGEEEEEEDDFKSADIKEVPTVKEELLN
jgi:hypothetical protein